MSPHLAVCIIQGMMIGFVVGQTKLSWPVKVAVLILNAVLLCSYRVLP